MAEEKAPSLRIFEKKWIFISVLFCVCFHIFNQKIYIKNPHGSIFLKSYINRAPGGPARMPIPGINWSIHVSKVYLTRYQCEFKSRN